MDRRAGPGTHRRREEVDEMVRIRSLLVTLVFSAVSAGVAAPSLAASIGLGAAGRLAPLRRMFDKVALGQGLELPTLSRPPR